MIPDYFSGSHFSITNLGGQVIYKGVYNVGNPVVITNLSPGIYFLNVEKNEIVHTQKFIK
jgi:hypothetical protein